MNKKIKKQKIKKPFIKITTSGIVSTSMNIQPTNATNVNYGLYNLKPDSNTVTGANGVLPVENKLW